MNQELWDKLSKHEQLRIIGGEILSASFWQYKNSGRFQKALKKALLLIQFSLRSPMWKKYKDYFRGLKDEVVRFQKGIRIDSIEILYRAL